MVPAVFTWRDTIYRSWRRFSSGSSKEGNLALKRLVVLWEMQFGSNKLNVAQLDKNVSKRDQM